MNQAHGVERRSAIGSEVEGEGGEEASPVSKRASCPVNVSF